MRHLILLLCLLMPTFAWAHTNQDDGLVWVALNLINADQIGHPSIQDDWITPCSQTSDTYAIPYGFAVKHPNRELTDGMCERQVEIRIGGWINDQFVFRRTLWWNPGVNGTNPIGIPREGTRSIKIILPYHIQIGDEIFHTPEYILLRPTGTERFVEIDVELHRLPSIEVTGTSVNAVNPEDLITPKVTWISETKGFMEPDDYLLHAPRGFLLEVMAEDRMGNTHRLTTAVRPQVNVDLSVFYGWTFHVQVLPKDPQRITKR